MKRTVWLLALCAQLPEGDVQRREMEVVLLQRLEAQVVRASAEKRDDDEEQAREAS